ncbi:MAG TPA: type II toxin-antitoxin system RelE/ParE family toxin [Segetibacter sp.]|jgi:plasmid stabilization system protein ParE
MPYKIEVRPLAAMEILKAYDWYESAKEGLGMEFLNELEAFYESLHRNPNTYSYYDKPVRQGKINRFPYVVVYESPDDISTIVIYSVFMAKQDPAKKKTM